MLEQRQNRCEATLVEVGGPYAAHRISPQRCSNSPVLALSPKKTRGSQVQCYGPPATTAHTTEAVTPLDNLLYSCTLQRECNARTHCNIEVAAEPLLTVCVCVCAQAWLQIAGVHIPESALGMVVEPGQGVVTYAPPVEAFATGIKIGSNDQRDISDRSSDHSHFHERSRIKKARRDVTIRQRMRTYARTRVARTWGTGTRY